MKTRVYNTAAQAIFLASLAVASYSNGSPAQAQYMVMEGGNAHSTTSSQVVCCQSIYVQDYSSFYGVNSTTGETENGLSSTRILNGMFDGYVGVFGAVICIPAIIIAVLRLFVRGQTDRKAKKNSFELPAAPAPTRFYRPSATANY
jgi:hypothetical protein